MNEQHNIKRMKQSIYYLVDAIFIQCKMTRRLCNDLPYEVLSHSIESFLVVIYIQMDNQYDDCRCTYLFNNEQAE